MSTAPAGSRVALIQRMFDHMAWADELIAAALVGGTAPADAVREFAHITGVEENWLSRVEQRAPGAPIWPDLDPVAAIDLGRRTVSGFRALIQSQTDATLDEPARYKNSLGQEFTTPLADILVHVALHGQYHRGKVNQILRQAGRDPAPADFISFVRGVPAATQPVSK
jgi:uncharacterized damage-inducible protein DinB